MAFRLASLGLLLSSSAAFAQTAPEPSAVTPPAAQPAAAPDAAAATPAETGISEIVVTASRRSENAQRAALSIQAVTNEALVRANVIKPEDLSQIAPGVSIANGGNYPQTYIRGVGNYATNTYAESAVAYNLDGVYISAPWATRGIFYDLDRVEVLKGPQGTLYGRNASGGAINIITAKPKLGEFGGFAEGEGGSYSLWRGVGAVNVPVGDTLAIRASGQVTHRDGYLSDGYDDDKEQSGRIQALWKPDSRLSVLLNAGYVHIGGMGGGSTTQPKQTKDPWTGASDPAITRIFTSQPGTGSLLVYPKDDGFSRINVYNVSAEINYDFGPATLTILPAYRDAKLSDSTYVPGFNVQDHTHDMQTSVETRLGHDSSNFKWVLGGYYFNENQDPYAGVPSVYVRQGVNTQYYSPVLNVRSYAAFGQATYSLTSRLRVTGGLRYTYERKTQGGTSTTYGFPGTNGGCSGASVFDPATPTPPLFCRTSLPLEGNLTYNSVTYKAGLEYDIAPRSLAYFNVSTGFKSGGFFAAPPPNTFRPEKLFALEGGVKNRFLDNKLQVNVEAFYYKYRDHQESHLGPTSIPGFFTFITENAGRAESYGGALDLVYAFTPQDQFNLLVQYDKSRYNSFSYSNSTAAFGPPATGCKVGPLVDGNQVVDCSGKQLVRAPTWTGSAGYSHTFELPSGATLIASAQAEFASSSYLAIDFLPSEQQQAYVLGNFDLTYTPDNKRWSVTGYVHNIGDTAVYTQALHSPFVTDANPITGAGGLNLSSIRPPRTFGGRVRFNF